MPKVSICIAVYNVEKYIEQCVRSLFEQTLDDLEYVFVDDATPDASIDIMLRVLEDYPHRKEQVKLIRHETNQGVAATRKDAIAAATGDYIIHCDPDDWVELDMYEKLYTKAVSENADMVYCNFKLFGWRTDEVTDLPEVTPTDMIKSFFDGRIHAGLCNKLWRKEIVKLPRDLPNDIFMSEDMRLNIQYLLDSTKCESVKDSLYCYRKTGNNITGYVDEKTICCRMKNILFFESILRDRQYNSALNIIKRDVLFQALRYGCSWKSYRRTLWISAKVGMITAQYTLKQKIIFFIACFNFDFARWLWEKIRTLK